MAQYHPGRSLVSAAVRFKARQPTQKNTHPNKNSLHKKFAQALSASFLLILQGKGGQFVQTVPQLFAQTVLSFGWMPIFKEFSCEPHSQGKATYLVLVQIEYGFERFQVRFGLVGSTAWIVSEYGFVILLDEAHQRATSKTVLGQHP